MCGKGGRPHARRSSKDARAVTAAQVHDDVTSGDGTGGNEPFSHLGDRRVGHREDHEVRALAGGDGVGDVGGRQHAGRAGMGGIGNGIDRYAVVADPLKCPRDDGAGTTRANESDAQARSISGEGHMRPSRGPGPWVPAQQYGGPTLRPLCAPILGQELLRGVEHDAADRRGLDQVGHRRAGLRRVG